MQGKSPAGGVVGGMRDRLAKRKALEAAQHAEQPDGNTVAEAPPPPAGRGEGRSLVELHAGGLIPAGRGKGRKPISQAAAKTEEPEAPKVDETKKAQVEDAEEH
jgi:hypothetical protein